MKGKLYKESEGYYLLVSNKTIGTTRPLLNFDIIEYKLSLENCQAIERGYDLDELAKIEYPICEVWNDEEALIRELAFKKGFQKAIELMGDKKFSEEDIHQALHLMNNRARIPIEGEALDIISKIEKQRDEIIQSLQQTEWDVTVEMEYVGECNGNNDEGCFQDSPGHNCGCFERRPKLDADGCLILKRIWKEN